MQKYARIAQRAQKVAEEGSIFYTHFICCIAVDTRE